VKRVEVVPPNPDWPQQFAQAAQEIAAALGDRVVQIHHIGSTSIPGIYAKPVIDLLVEVDDINAVDAHNESLAAIGYEAMGEFGIPGRRYFRRDNAAGFRTHNAHTFATASPEIARHLTFRDYMIAHPDHAQTYSELKQKLAAQFPTDIEGYMDGKDSFIKAMDQQAAIWQRSHDSASKLDSFNSTNTSQFDSK